MNRTFSQIVVDIASSKKLIDGYYDAMGEHRRELKSLDDKWHEECARHDNLLKELHESIYSTVQP